jgi:restriction system protein
MGELVRKVSGLLIDKENGMPVREIFNKIQETTELTDFEKGFYPSSPDSPRFMYLIRFKTIGMVKAGWLEKKRGIWKLTDEGKSAYNRIQDPEEFTQEIDRLYKEWDKNQPQEESIEDIEEVEAPVSPSVTFEEAQEKSWDQIKDYLSKMNPYDFQFLVADLLRAIGYHVDWVAPRGPDGGLDIIAYMDPLGTKTPRIKVQVKHQISSSMGANDLRGFYAVIGNDNVGIFVSSGGFTRDAEAEARSQENRKITLIDLDKLFELWVQHYDKLTHEARQRLPLKPIYFLAPEE